MFKVRAVKNQFALQVIDFSSQYGKEDGSSYTVTNLAGTSQVYPSYGDFTKAAVLRTYGPWWKQCPSASRRIGHNSPPTGYCSEDFVELLYESRVWLHSVKIYETFNPGTVVRILAADCPDYKVPGPGCPPPKWTVVWQSFSGPEGGVPQESRIFQPIITPPSLPTRLLRLEFNSSLCRYYTELDAVEMEGTLISPNYMEPAIVQEMDKLNIASEVDIVEEKSLSLFECLPSEIIQKIFSYVDLSTLARLARVSHTFYDNTISPSFLQELNLRPYCYRVSNKVLATIAPRYLHQLRCLDLSWCGNHSLLTAGGLHHFLEQAGGRITDLRMANCGMLMCDIALQSVTELCPLLQELDLSSCRNVSSTGFQTLIKLKYLERLNLYRTQINLESLVKVVRSCPSLRHLNLGSCCRITKWDDLCKEVGEHCRGLLSLDLWRAQSLSPVGLRALADNCPDLAELDLGWCSQLHSGSTCFVYLAQKCQKLKKLFLTANRSVCDSDLAAVAQYCPLMEQLDVLGTREITKEQAKKLLDECKQLRMFDVSFCAAIDFRTVRAWQAEFPNCAIQMSFQTAMERDFNERPTVR